MRHIIKISISFFLIFLSPNLIAGNGAVSLVYPVETNSIIIDGNVNDWPDTIKKVMIEREFSGNEMPVESDFSAYFQTAYDAKTGALYVAIVVNDDSHIHTEPDPDKWLEQDNVTLYLDVHHTENGSGSQLYLMMDDNKLINGITGHWDPAIETATWETADAKMRRSGTQSIYEYKFEIGRNTSAGITVGFDLLIVDVDQEDVETNTNALYIWGPFGGKSQSSRRVGDLVLMTTSEDAGVLKGRVAWHDSVDSTYTHGRVRITKKNNKDFWLILNTDEAGEFEVTLPAGEYVLSSAVYVVGNPWQGLVMPDLTSTVIANVIANETTQAQTLSIKQAPEPELIKEKGVLFDYDKSQKAEIDATIKSYMNYFRVPGASVSLIKGGDVVYYNVFGNKNSFTGEPVTEDTIFEAASITKAVFAYAVSRMAERGEIDLDKPLFEYLPFEAIAHDERYKKITGRHALSHQTGFPNWAWQNEDNQIDIKFYPGIKFGYSGEGFEYLGRVVSHIKGKPLEQVLMEEVQIPLDMQKNVFFSDSEALQEVVSHGHFDGYAATRATPSEVGVAHSMHTEARVFTNFILGLMQQKGMSEQGYANMLEPQIEVPIDPSEGDWPYPQRYSLGFHLMNTPFGLAYGHGGNNGDFTCIFHIYKEHDIAFAIFTNANTGTAMHKKLHEYLIYGNRLKADIESFEDE